MEEKCAAPRKNPKLRPEKGEKRRGKSRILFLEKFKRGK